ncbi:serine hydrolase domain-containing protein [Flagellimonas aequoris]|uniref:Beta-lactamase family protein n=1 Tax=Flagellimonas aequoris TaxID=2306997 RepID=A0A418N8E7_9FLAO|nr:serine hydrolase domain-containing protein [Allomuricauda aequoris]RIV71560.1 class A beta-lactamase-related serine hydrolase [Allomuricauda aequoris]TXK03124.1 beta-lactamase family protein [Allomuricauda aequoris]
MRSHLICVFLLSLCTLSCKNANNIDFHQDIQAIENGLLPPILVKGDSVKGLNLMDRMQHHNVPGVSIALVENGKLKWAKGYGIANSKTNSTIDTNTLFQAGSISKPIAALAALQLVENAQITLDADVNDHLIDWKVPESDFTSTQKVTLRRLLSHTAGTNVHGFPGYAQKDTFPSITAVLNGKGNTPKIIVDTIPGSIWRYSGGGYTIVEKLIEDISGQPFERYMHQQVLQPLGMNNSTYEQPLPPHYHKNASAAYDTEGSMFEGQWYNHPEQAAAGLWTTPTDLAKYCIQIQEILSGAPNGILKKPSVEEMLTDQGNDWGLGPSLDEKNGALVFRHAGKNVGFTNEFIAYAHQGNAVIIMTNADNGGKLIGEILRSVSAYYHWDLNNPLTIELMEVNDDELSRFTGKYVLDFQVAGIGDYLIDVDLKDNSLRVTDPNNGDINILRPTKKWEFMDLDKGDKVTFRLEKDSIDILWNNRFLFHKVE